MVSTIKSKNDGRIIITKKEEVWEIKSNKHFQKFWKWIQKKKIMPGDAIPMRIFKRYYKKL